MSTAASGSFNGARIAPSRGLLLPALLLVGLGAAVLIRNAVGGAGVAGSVPAGLVFAALLVGLTLLVPPLRGAPSGFRPGVRRTFAGVAAGLAGAAVLCVPAVLTGVIGGWPSSYRPMGAFVGWAAVVTVVATAEEVFLRGSLFRVLERFGAVVAIGVPAVAFAALHLPLYGWGAMPLDLAVGVWLGALRLASGSVAAPVVAHTAADWVAYWLV